MSFFACRIAPGEKVALPSRDRPWCPGHILQLKHAALSKSTGSARLTVSSCSSPSLVLCSLRPGCEQSCLGVVLDERDLAALEASGECAIDVVGGWVRAGFPIGSESEEESEEEGLIGRIFIPE